MTSSIFIFNIPKVVTLTLGGNTGAALMNFPVNRTDFKLIKGITNEIYFFVKDTDRHPITANGLANAGITDLRVIITDRHDIDNETLLLGSQDGVLTEYTTTIATTTTTLSNNTIIVSNTSVTSSNSVSDPNTVVIPNTITNASTLVANTGAGYYVAPFNVNAVTVELWGPGGAGALGNLAGAGGGAYAKKTFAVNEGDNFDYFVGNSAPYEQSTFWGNAVSPDSAIFGAFSGAGVANNVIDIDYQYGAPFGDYDVGYYGGAANTFVLTGAASAWSGGNADTNPAGLDVSNVEGGGPSSQFYGTTPGGGAPAGAMGDANTVVFGGPGQLRITEYYINAIADANAISNSNTVSNSGSDSNTITNSVTVTNSASTTTTYTTTVASIDPSLLIPAPGIDPAKGVWLLTLKATDIVDWPLGYLQYIVIGDRASGDQVMLYTDRAYGPYSGCEVIHGPFPRPVEAYSITPEDCINQGHSLYSGAYRGAAQVGNLSGIQSAVIQLTDFTGSFSVQASLENEAPVTDSDWAAANITTASNGTVVDGTVNFVAPNAVTGPVFVQFEGNYMWVRFIVHTAMLSTGKWTGIDFRND
jgi:hypothetical protein